VSLTGEPRKMVERIAGALHFAPAKATRAALREYPDGNDRSLRRDRDLLAQEVLELRAALIDAAHDLFVLAGAEHHARELAMNFGDLKAALDEARKARTVCKGCGCTDSNACPGGCSWATRDLCSRCKARREGKKNG
jgi:hypothetical protein